MTRSVLVSAPESPANGITVKAVYGFILSIIGINGIPEAIVAAVITLVLGKTLMKKGVQERLGV